MEKRKSKIMILIFRVKIQEKRYRESITLLILLIACKNIFPRLLKLCELRDTNTEDCLAAEYICVYKESVLQP